MSVPKFHTVASHICIQSPPLGATVFYYLVPYMPRFSATSAARLATCDDRLRVLFDEIVKTYDCSILCGHRGREQQEQAYREGKSKARFGESLHNTSPSRAVDVVPYPVHWEDRERFAHFAGYVQAVADRLGIKIRWGGDWDQDGFCSDETFSDMPHFELVED